MAHSRRRIMYRLHVTSGGNYTTELTEYFFSSLSRVLTFKSKDTGSIPYEEGKVYFTISGLVLLQDF